MFVRLTYWLGFAIALGLLGTSIYFQMIDGFIPCPLCTLQRFTFGLLGILFFIGLLLAANIVRSLLNYLIGLTSLLGMFLAGRQVWLQHFPPTDGTECSVSIQYMMQVLPITEVIKRVLSGGTECSQRGWELLHLNMAEWSFICFLGFFALALCLIIKKNR